jgi:Peptidase family C25
MKNQLKPLIICVFTAFYSFVCKGNETVIFTKRLQWNDLNNSKDAPKDVLDFEDSFKDGASSSFPLIVHRQPLKEFSSVQDIRWTEIESANLPIEMLRANNPREIAEDWEIKTRVSDGRGQYYLIITILPIRKVTDGSYERLMSYNLEIDFAPSVRPNIRNLTFADNSVLKEGNWYKIAIAKDGVYKIDKNLLAQLGIDISTLDPQAINIYGNGGQILPSSNEEFRYDDLQKCAIYTSAQTDFQDNDYILFYGKGPDKWQLQYDEDLNRKIWTHTKHYYSDSAYYFIRTDDLDPKRIQPLASTTQTPTYTSNKFQDFAFIENDLFNIGETGREFFGDVFDLNTSSSFSFSMPNLDSNYPATFEGNFAVRSMGGPSYFTVNVGNNSMQTNPVTSSDGALALIAGVSHLSTTFNPTGSSVTINANLNKYSNTAEIKGWIDYLRINATRSLTMSGNQMKFRDTTSVGFGNICQFELGSAASVYQLWDITDYLNPMSVNFTLSGSNAEWRLSNEVVHEFISFNNTGYLTPTPKGKLENQNLHALQDVDIVIVAAPALMEAATQLAEIHSSLGNTVVLTTFIEICNEFSCGNPDVTAIRMMMKMLYDRANGDISKMPENLLLFGDGDYGKNKGVSAFTGSNMIIFESDESLSPAVSYVSDDYFVFLSDDDDASASNLLDAGVGRIPATDATEALAYVEKVRAYISQNTTEDGSASCIGDATQSPFGPWRNILTFISDDQDGNGDATEQIHLQDADELSALMKVHHPEYDIVKIYMDAFKQESTPGGERYTDGENAIRNRVQNGSLLVTYLGHGGERGWAHERILDLNTISSWTNKYKLPVFLTATCELARYDNPAFNTAGEMLVMNPNGGAIAMLTTTRVVFAGSNMEMDLAFFDVALEEANINNLTLGMINMLTKNGVNPTNTSKPNFSLLGDPALKMVYPKFNVYTTMINGIDLTNFTDTLKALQEVEFKGYVGDAQGNKLSDFNGFIYPTVFDKLTHVYTQNNDFDGSHGVVQEYDVFNKNIFKGKASVSGGDFAFKFVIPYDINYTVDTGRVSYYSVAGNIDAHGYSQSFMIGSSLSGAQLNTVGPNISLYLNDTTFVSGGISDTKPILLAKLRDENGINTVGNGIGHDLIAILDSDSQNPIVLNEYYETDLDTYKSGEVRYQMPELTEGNHTLSLKAWDIHNNSSTSALDFTVADNSTIALDHVLNYPNPFTTHTEFMFEHNQVCQMLDVRLQVFTVSGKLVKTFEQQVMQNGFRSEPIAWDGTDDFGDRIGRGVYVYKLEVRNEDGQKAEQFEKLVILK